MGRSLTVLHLIDTGGPGGAETVFRNLVTELDRERWRSVPVVPVRDWLHDELVARGESPLVSNSAGRGDIAYLARLHRLLSVHQVDVVHTHLLGSAVYASVVASIRRLPVVCTFHGTPDIPAKGRLLGVKLRAVWRPSNRVVFVSRKLRDTVLRTHGLPAENTRVIHNGIDTSAPALHGSERQELGGSDDVPLIGAVGNLRPAKDYGTLLRATALLRDAGLPVRVVVLGQGAGSLLKALLSLRSELNLDDAVSFLGFRADARRLMTAFDLFVTSSSSEGFSLSTVEALSLGLPVVSTRSGGPEEIIRHQTTGLLVPTRDPAALAMALGRVLRNPEWARSLGTRGRTDVQRRFSMDQMVTKYQDLYAEVIQYTGATSLEGP